MATGDEPVYVISVAARLAAMPSWMLRVLDQEGVVVPQRTDSKRRLYSDNDIAVLKRVHALMERKVNVEGIKVILEMEREARMKSAPAVAPPPALTEPEALPLPAPEGHENQPVPPAKGNTAAGVGVHGGNGKNGVRAGSVEELALAIPEVTDLVSVPEG
jgi:MerR family transcriptional regulator, heat shock protein HspR